jgi:hypothetical protein
MPDCYIDNIRAGLPARREATMFGRVRDFFFGTLLRRMIFAMTATAWFAATLVTVPNPGWNALIISPFLVGALVVGTLVRTWWAIPICSAVYFIAAAVSFLLWVDESSLTYSSLVLSAVMLAVGIAAVETWVHFKGELGTSA